MPKNLNERFTADGRAFDEYPMLPETKQRLVPEVVALATSAAGYWVGLMGNDVLPVEPRCFKAIVAYEGDRVVVDGRRIGRVVVDSSFHHFVDINLRGTGSNDPDKRGFYDHNGNPTRDYEAFKQYYRNIVKWLCPPRLRMELYHSLLLDLRFNSFLLEEIRPVSDPNWKDILHAGIVTRKAIVERFSNAEAIQCCTSLLTNIPPPLALAIESIINPWLPSSLSGSAWPNAINQSFFLNAVLGIAMLAIATELPDDRHRAAERLGEASTPTEVLSAIIAKNSKEAMAQISSVLDRSRQRLGEISAMLLAST